MSPTRLKLALSAVLLTAGTLFCDQSLTGGGQSTLAAGEVGYAKAVDRAEGDFFGKWTFQARATCRCANNSCKTITCDGESSISYEDARFKAMLELQLKANSENGRIEGTPSISIRYEF